MTLDCTKLKMGDTVVFRNGGKSKICLAERSIKENNAIYIRFPEVKNYGLHVHKNGKIFVGATSIIGDMPKSGQVDNCPFDIVKIIKATM